VTDSRYQPPRARLLDRPVGDSFPIEHEAFAGRGFGLRPPGAFTGPKLVIDGAELAGKRGRFSVRDNAGNDVEVRLKRSGLDPVPKVVIGERTIQVARPLAWYEYAPLALSWVLVPLGGALGALTGIVATAVGARVLRSDRPPAARLALAAAISVGSVVAFFLVAGVVGILIHQRTHSG
jgi:hypothetical protein